MGLLDSIPGLAGINFDLGSILGKIGSFLLIVILFIFCMIIVFTFLWLKKRKELYNKKVYWFEEIHGDMVPIDNDVAAELTIPGTNIQVFYIKRKDMYLPRPTIAMGKDSYWFAIRKNREIVNFKMKNINQDMKEANLDYDHSDMRFALQNLKELIKRNYKDKATKWWMEYKEVIGLVVLIFVLSLSFFFLISKVGALIDKASALIEHADNLVKVAQATSGSGVIQAG